MISPDGSTPRSMRETRLACDGRAAACARDHAACLSAHVRGALRGEVDKDFVKMPVHEIEQQLTGAQK